MSVLSFAIMPRAKFLQTMLLNIVSMDSVVLLRGYTKLQRLEFALALVSPFFRYGAS